MENEIITRRGLIIILVAVTIVVFVGLVWLIGKLAPWEILGLQRSTDTPGAQAMNNCAYPISYWVAHPELYPQKIVIGGTEYTKRELAALLADNNPDIGQQLRAQLAVAFLNSLSGADQSSIETTIFTAYGWLVEHPTGSAVPENALEEGRRLYELVEAYNKGSGEVAPCEVASATTKTATPGEIGATQTTSTPSQTSTTTPTRTPLITTAFPGTLLTPSATALPTTARPVVSSLTPTTTSPAGPTMTPTSQASTPTRTSVPTFTNTPPPTFTPTPPATPTVTPPPTPTYTPPPPPTPTYTPPPSP